MQLRTRLCERLGIALPIVQAPIGSAPELAAAVSNAGGLGMLALTWTDKEGAADRIGRTRALTELPFGVNLCLAFPIADQLSAALDAAVPVISTFWGDPAGVAAEIRAAGATHLHTVGSPEEARAVVDCGVDAVVAQGWEAGGHVWGQVATLPLVPAVVDAVSPVPVIAAGGIADGRGVAAVLALGAEAAWLGTRFLTASEAPTHDDYREAICRAHLNDTVHTTCFDGGWPHAPHRVLRNDTLTSWEDAGRRRSPHRPGEDDVVATDAGGREVLRYADTTPHRGLHGSVLEMALYAGQSAGLVRETASAADIVRSLADEARAVFSSWAE